MNEQLKASYEQILSNLGEDVNRPGLKDTPARAAKAMQYLCDGYNMTIEEIVNGALFARIVDMYARRLQIQENITLEIAQAIQSVTNAAGVGVVIEAKHMCMMMRGVEKQNSAMISSVMLGEFRDSSRTRQEFLQLIGLN